MGRKAKFALDANDEEDVEATKDHILDSALDIFANKGYYDTRMDDIALHSNTSKGAIYFYFPNKERLFLALIDQFTNLLERRVTDAVKDEAAGMDRVRVALEVCLETFGKYRRPAKLILIQAVGLGVTFEEKRNQIYERFAKLIAKYLREAIALKHIQDVDVDIIAWAWMGAIYSLVMRWIATGKPDPQRIMRALVPALLHSVQFDSKK
jgi:AcrR family transcriptional regulator